MTRPEEAPTYEGFGADTVQRLLPHRRPFLMVDRVTSFRLGAAPTLVSSRYVSANEAIFDGHFPGFALWPGVYTIEGMGQSCQLLSTLMEIGRLADDHGLGAARALEALVAIDRQRQLKPSRVDETTAVFLRALAARRPALGLSARVDVKLLRPVMAGQRLDYAVRHVKTVDASIVYEVGASVDGAEVASGRMFGSLQDLDFLGPG